MSEKNKVIPNDFQTAKYLIDCQNYTFKQLQYLYLPVEDMPNPRVHEICKLSEKAENLNDFLNDYKILEKWGPWVREHKK